MNTYLPLQHKVGHAESETREEEAVQRYNTHPTINVLQEGCEKWEDGGKEMEEMKEGRKRRERRKEKRKDGRKEGEGEGGGRDGKRKGKKEVEREGGREGGQGRSRNNILYMYKC